MPQSLKKRKEEYEGEELDRKFSSEDVDLALKITRGLEGLQGPTDSRKPWLQGLNSKLPIPNTIHPRQFQKTPEISGSGVARTYDDLVKVNPHLGTGKVSKIQVGEPQYIGVDIDKWDQKVNDPNRTQGQYYPKDKKITMNPYTNFSTSTKYNTLAHELLHGLGHGENTTSEFSDKLDSIGIDMYDFRKDKYKKKK